MNTREFAGANWRKSSYSGGGDYGGDCVEVAHLIDGTLALRDSKAPHHGVLPANPHLIAWLKAHP